MTTQNSDYMANMLASPTVKNDVAVAGGRLRVFADSWSNTGTSIDAAGDIIRIFRVPGRARIYGIFLFWDDHGTTLTGNLGLYDTSGNALDSDCYVTSSGLNLAAATTETTWYNYRYGGGAQGLIGDTGQMVYQDAGQSSPDTYKDMDLCITITGTPASVSASTTMDAVVWYAID